MVVVRPSLVGPARALAGVAGEAERVLLVGLDEYEEACRSVLAAADVELVRVRTVAAAIDALDDRLAQVVIASADLGDRLVAAVRADREIASAHIVVCAALDSATELRTALDAGADDVMRVPFEPEVLVARVAAGLRAARLRESEALLRSLVANLPGAVYRCACDEDWTMQWLSGAIEELSGYPASDFIDSAVRTFASVIHPDDREQVERSVMAAVEAGRPFTLEYRIVRPDGGERWVLERGQAQDSGTAGAGSTARSSTSPRGAPPSRRCASARSSTPSWPRYAPRGRGSWRRPTSLGARSSAICTTVRSSGWCRPPCGCRCG